MQQKSYKYEAKKILIQHFLVQKNLNTTFFSTNTCTLDKRIKTFFPPNEITVQFRDRLSRQYLYTNDVADRSIFSLLVR